MLVVLGAVLKRWLFFLAGLLFTIATALSFVGEVGLALGSECTGIGGVTCISGYIGQGSDIFSGDVISWGFKPGFYLFLVSGLLIFATMALQRFKDSPLVVD